MSININKIKENTAINVMTQEEYNALMKLCEESKYIWTISRENPTKTQHYWLKYKESTCVEITPNKTLFFSPKKYYEKNNINIISFQEFLKAQGIS
jgi:hypothetical protein